MIFLVWAVWFCTLLLGCICFPLQNSYDLVPGYPEGDVFIAHASPRGPQSTNKLHGVPASRPQNLVYLQSGLDHNENSEDANEEIVQSKLHPGHMTDDIQGASSVQKTDDSDQQHPFELLIRDSQNGNHVEGVSFPTVKDLKRFVEILKSSYLMPGGDLTKHFLTAREMIAKGARAQYAQAELGAAQRAAAAAESASVYGGSENEVYNEPPEAALSEQIEQNNKYQTASKTSSFSDPVDSTTNVIFTSLHDKQDLALPPSSYIMPRSAAKGIDGSARERFENGLFTGENPKFRNRQNKQEEDARYIQSDKLGKEISADARTKPFNSYARRIKVSPPKTPFNISDYFPQRSKESPIRPPYKPTNGKSKDVYKTPTGHLQLSDSSVSSKSNSFPRHRTSQGATQSSSPHNFQNEVLRRKRPIGSHYTLNVKHTNNRDGYLEESPPQHPNSIYQEPGVHNHPTSNSAGQHSSRTQAHFPIKGTDANFNTLRIFPLPASPQTAFSRLIDNVVMPRFTSTSPGRSPTQGTDRTRNVLLSFLNQQSRGPSLNRASLGSVHAGILQNFMERSKLWNHPHGSSQRFGNMVHLSPGTSSASKFLNYAINGRVLPNGGRNRPLFPWRGYRTPASKENLNSAKSRIDFVSGGDPQQLWQEKPGVSQWESVLRPRRASTQTP